MPEAWDTMTAGHLRPRSDALELARRRRRAGDPIAVTATTLNEMFHGLYKSGEAGRRAAHLQAQWLRDELAGGLLTMLPLDGRAAEVAAALRAWMPIPPAGRRRRNGRSKPESSVAWILDLQTAATVFVHGYDLVSADAHHTVIAACLATLAPSAPPMKIRTPSAL